MTLLTTPTSVARSSLVFLEQNIDKCPFPEVDLELLEDAPHVEA